MEHHRADEGGEEYHQAATGEEVAAGHEAEQTGRAAPRIFLADASQGRPDEEAVRGIWVDAAVEENELEQAVHQLLRTTSAAGAKAYRIGAAVGFEGFEVTEHESLATVSRVANGITHHGRAFVAYVEAWGTSQEAVTQFDDYYQGTWPNVTAWAEAAAEDYGWRETLERDVEPHILPYLRIDFERLGRDMAHDAYVVEDDEQQEVHIFRLEA